MKVEGLTVTLITYREDNKVLLWDIRSAKGALVEMDQHNGDSTAGPNSGTKMCHWH